MLSPAVSMGTDSDCEVFVMISRYHAFTASCTLLHLRYHKGNFLPLKLSLTNAFHAVQLQKECTSHSHTHNVQTLTLHSDMLYDVLTRLAT